MEKKKRLGCILAALITTIVVAILLIALFKFTIGPRLAENKRAELTHPTVIVHEPSTGDTVFESELVTASATAISRNPIARLEVWLDGEKFQEQTPQAIVNTYYGSFEVAMGEGDHLLVFRAVDREGLVGQSLPITITSTAGLVTVETEEEGQTLEKMVAALGEEAGVLQDLNPDLRDKDLPVGTNVTVPAPPAQAGGAILVDPPDAEPTNKQPADLSKFYEVSATNISVGAYDLISALLSNMPQAPTSLHAEYKDCVVELRWKDNAENETQFNIWMQRVYGPPQLIETTNRNPKNGPTVFEFKSPIFGFYNFWVEAANNLGSQPSEIKQVFVSDKDCGGNLATSLEIEALDMYTYGPHEAFYCYLSVDGTRYRRIPENESESIQVQDNWGNITKHWGGDKRIQFPMPEDEELTLEGSCLADLGPLMVSPLTSFNTSVPREKWDGSRLEITTDSFLIGYRVQPFGSESAQGRFHYVNYDLNPPDIWNVEAEGELQVPEKDWKARTVTLSWHWEGDPEKINNFLILIDGEEYRYVNKLQRQESILMGSACGQTYSFKMVAVGSGGARSAPSTAFIYEQPPCAVMAEVQFLTVISKVTDDTDCVPPFMHTCFSYTGGACNPLGVWYELWAMGAGQEKVKVGYGSPTISIHYECGNEYQFSILGPNQDTIIVPVDPASPSIRIGTTFWESDGGPHDKFGVTDELITFDYDLWPSVDQIYTFSAPMMSDTADATIKVRVRGFYQTGP